METIKTISVKVACLNRIVFANEDELKLELGLILGSRQMLAKKMLRTEYGEEFRKLDKKIVAYNERIIKLLNINLEELESWEEDRSQNTPTFQS